MNSLATRRSWILAVSVSLLSTTSVLASDLIIAGGRMIVPETDADASHNVAANAFGLKNAIDAGDESGPCILVCKS